MKNSKIQKEVPQFIVCVCLCVCYWPPFREVCPNYEVVKFQPPFLITPDLGSVAYCNVAYLLVPPHPLLLPSDVLSPQPSSSVKIAQGTIHPPGRHSSLSQHTEKPPPAFPSPVTSIDRLIIASLVPTKPAKFPSPPLPCCRLNIF